MRILTRIINHNKTMKIIFEKVCWDRWIGIGIAKRGCYSFRAEVYYPDAAHVRIMPHGEKWTEFGIGIIFVNISGVSIDGFEEKWSKEDIESVAVAVRKYLKKSAE